MTAWMQYIYRYGPIPVIAAFGITLSILLFRYFTEPGGYVPFFSLIRRFSRQPSAIADGDASLATRKLRRTLRKNSLAFHHQMRIIAFVFTVMAISRILIFLTVVIGFAAQGRLGDMLTNMNAYWVRWDASHYLNIAENWYATAGEEQVFLVFLPLFPLIVRAIKPLFFGHSAIAAIVVNHVFLLVSGWAMYHLIFDQQGERAAKRSILLLMFCPMSVFFSVPYTESLFLMLTLLVVLLAKRRSFSFSIAVGALAAFTRTLGLVIAVPIYLEMLKHVSSLSLWPARKRRHIGLIAMYTGMVSLIGVGFLAYMYVNWRVAGDPLMFLTHQREHWHQSFGSIGNTLRYTLNNAFTDMDLFWRHGTWIPQAISIFAVTGLLSAVVLKIYPGDGAYAWVYLICALSPTWLLSGPRYIAAMYALYPMLTLTTRRRWAEIAVLSVFIICLVYTSYSYAVTGNLL